MPTKYQSQLAMAQRIIKAKGQLVHYSPGLVKVTANDPSKPWQVGTPTGVDPNAPHAVVDVYMVFLDAKARGSSTQGMVAELVDRTDIVGGNKLGLLPGGVGITPIIGDMIERNTGDITTYQPTFVSKIKVIDVDGYPILFTLELEL